MPPSTCFTRSSAPTRSAPASRASWAASPAANTATRTSLPVPAGSDTVLRSIWSALRGSTPSLKATSTLSSKLRFESDFTSSNALAGSCSWVLSYFLAASAYFFPGMFPRSSRAPSGCPLIAGRGRAGGEKRLVDDVDAHRARRPCDLQHRALDVDRVHVGHLHFRDLADLGLGHLRNLLAARRRRALLDPRGLPQQHRSRRRLGDERERPILVDRDLRGDHRAALRLGRRVVRLAEVHDVDAVRPERGPDRRRGRRRTGLDLDLHNGRDATFCHDSSSGGSCYSLATSPNSSSTGVSRPKMFTSTLSFERSTSISLITPLKSANGPFETRTCSPTSYSSRGRTFFSVPGAPTSVSPVPRMSSTSRRESGVGFAPLPTNPVTPGVFRTTYQASSSRPMRTSR